MTKSKMTADGESKRVLNSAAVAGRNIEYTIKNGGTGKGVRVTPMNLAGGSKPGSFLENSSINLS